MWSLCTALTPAAASLGNVQIIAIRVLLGAGEGLLYPFEIVKFSVIYHYPAAIFSGGVIISASGSLYLVDLILTRSRRTCVAGNSLYDTEICYSNRTCNKCSCCDSCLFLRSVVEQLALSYNNIPIRLGGLFFLFCCYPSTYLAAAMGGLSFWTKNELGIWSHRR